MTEITTEKQNLSFVELGTEKISKLLTKYSIPAIIAMTASAIYNITDSIFIGHGAGPMAISGFAITFPVMNLAAAFGSLIGAGGSALLSLRLGQKDYLSAKKILGNVILLNLIIGSVFSFIMLSFLDKILLFFGATENTLPYARDFMHIILFGTVITHLYLGLNALLRSLGSPLKAMIATLFTVVLNLILNPMFIFGFKLGIKGSALATVISQSCVLIWQLSVFLNKKNMIRIEKSIFKLSYRIVKEIFSIGLSPFLMNFASCIIIIIINRGLVKYGGDLAVGAYGIVNRMSFLFVLIVFGLNQGMQPIAGYNYGAKLFDRVSKVLKITILFATIVVTVGFIVVHLFPNSITSFFTSDQQLINLTIRGMKFAFMFFPIIGFQMVSATFFQSIGMAYKAIFLSLTRQVIFLIPCLLILPSFLGIDGIWISLPISDLASTILTAILLTLQLKKLKKGTK